jgi:hypothetical protein
MQSLKFLVDKRHWFGGLFCYDTVRGVTSIHLSATFLKLKFLWKIQFLSDGFKRLSYLDVRSYLFSNHFRVAVNSFFMDYDTNAKKKFVLHHNFTG